MDFKLSEQQNVLKSMVKELALNQLEPNATRIDEEAEFPAENVQKMKELMLLGMTISPDFGGAGMDTVSYVVAMEELSKKCLSTAMVFFIQNSLVAGTILREGTQEQKAKWLPELASGAKLGAFGVEDSFTNESPLEARRDGDGWVLTGTMPMVFNAPDAQTMVVCAKTGQDEKKVLRSLFVLDMGADGVEPGNPEETMGIRGVRCAPVTFNDCKLGADSLIGEENKGDALVDNTIRSANIPIAAAGVGISQESLDQSISYSKERVQFGRPISSFQAIQWKLVKMATEIESARLLTYQAAVKADSGEDFSKEAAMARCFSSEMAAWAAVEAIQVHGGFGYTKEAVVERHFRDSRVLSILEGTAEGQKERIAGILLR